MAICCLYDVVNREIQIRENQSRAHKCVYSKWGRRLHFIFIISNWDPSSGGSAGQIRSILRPHCISRCSSSSHGTYSDLENAEQTYAQQSLPKISRMSWRENPYSSTLEHVRNKRPSQNAMSFGVLYVHRSYYCGSIWITREQCVADGDTACDRKAIVYRVSKTEDGIFKWWSSRH